MSRKIVTLLFIYFLCSIATAQNKDSKTIAPFKIRLVDGKGFTYDQLEKNKPVILVYFSTTCDHCKTFTTALLKRMNKLKGNQVVMISYEHIKDVQAFDDAYKLSAYPNIKIGSEGYTFIVQKHYNIQQYPFVAKYNSEGKLVKIISQSLVPEEMAAQL